jgi:Ala-tRNA(Pro) deacylase
MTSSPHESPSEAVVRRLTEALEREAIPFSQSSHREVRTSEEAAAVRGTPLHSGAKALLVKGEAAFTLLVMPADMALDSAAARRLIGAKRMRFATPDELLELTGLLPGSVPPFGSLFGLRSICDEHLADNSQINFNAGSRSQSIKMAYEDYVRFESPVIARIAKPKE